MSRNGKGGNDRDREKLGGEEARIGPLSELGEELEGHPCAQSPSYRVAWKDPDYLRLPELRGMRLMMEYHKPDRAMRMAGIRRTVVVFGSARALPEDVALKRVAAARKALQQNPEDAALKKALKLAERDLEKSRWYEEARRFAALVAADALLHGREDLAIMTGGGPGIMEAANRGAYEAGALSVGLNITLPHEQVPNRYITPHLCFDFHYFAIRKMHFMLRAIAMVVFPGGFGTLDELFKTLTLIQTGKSRSMPVVLAGRAFWSRLIDFDLLVEWGNISPEDVELFTIVDTAEEAMAAIHDFYGGNPLENDAV